MTYGRFFIPAVVSMALLAASCGDAPEHRSDETKSDTTAREITFVDLLFADQSLSDMVPANAKADQYSKDWREVFGYVAQQVRDGKTLTARETLRAMLNRDDIEERVRLLIWAALRDLGERPPATIADSVRGVILEVPVGNSVDILAAYSDGTARYLNHSGAIVLWDHDDTHHDSLISAYLHSADALVRSTQAADRHRLEQDGMIHVTALTYGGVHATNVATTAIDASPTGAAVFNAGTDLMESLLRDVREKRTEAQER
jgi:hypothetical protein